LIVSFLTKTRKFCMKEAEDLATIFGYYFNKFYAFLQSMKTLLPRIIALALTFVAAASNLVMAQNDLNLALSKPGNSGATATASATSVENASLVASNVNDGNQSTRWASAYGPTQSLVINLGSVQAIDRIRISWEQAYAVDFELQVATNSDFSGYTVVKQVTDNAPAAHNGQFLNEFSNLNATGQYIRLVATRRHVIDNNVYGYSIYEFEVFGFSNSAVNNLIVNQKSTAFLSASSTDGTYVAANAFDGNPETRWSTQAYEYQILQVDFKTQATVSRAYLSWAGAYATNFSIEYAPTQADVDANNWSPFATYTNNQAFYDEVAGTATARFYRVLARKSVLSNGGFSIYEFALFGNAAPLPVSLASFTAAPQGSAVAVKWTTASEQNNAGFEVQRSTDGMRFESVAKVAGAVNSQVAQAYKYLDAAPLRGTSYYRLKQIDLDGSATYSPVVGVQQTGAPVASLTIYPNPTPDQATMQWEATAAGVGQWHLVTTTGQVVQQQAFEVQPGLNSQRLDLRAVPAGSYVLTVEAGGQLLRRQLVQKVQ
jgi:hypothetical protein